MSTRWCFSVVLIFYNVGVYEPHVPTPSERDVELMIERIRKTRLEAR
jgi:hypothetical protein